MPIISYGLDARALTVGAKTVSNKLAQIGDKASAVGQRLGNMFNPFNAAIGGLVGAAGAVKLAQIGDEYTNMAAQLEYLTGSAAAASEAQDLLYRMSQKTGTSMTANAKALTRFELASDQTKLTTEENVKVLGAINSMMIKTGVSSMEASAAMVQLGQALASGRLQGDEFRSMAENAPAIMNELARTLGVTRGELKEMATEGELTSEVLGQAFLSMAESASSGASELPLTVGRMWQKLINSTQRMWDAINDRTGLLSYVANGFDNLAYWVEENTDLIISYVLDLRDAFFEVWPDIKAFMMNFASIAVDMANAYIQAWPAISSFFSGTMQLIRTLTPYISGLVNWVSKLINKFIELAKYTPLGVGVSTLATGGSALDVVKNVFDPSQYGAQEASGTTPTQQSGTTIVNNFNGQYSRSDVTAISVDQQRQANRS